MTRGDPDFEAFERSAHERARRAEERERTARQRAERARAEAARARDDAVRLEREREAEAHERAAAAHRLAVDFQHEHAQHSRQQAERRGGDQPAERVIGQAPAAGADRAGSPRVWRHCSRSSAVRCAICAEVTNTPRSSST